MIVIYEIVFHEKDPWGQYPDMATALNRFQELSECYPHDEICLRKKINFENMVGFGE